MLPPASSASSASDVSASVSAVHLLHPDETLLMQAETRASGLHVITVAVEVLQGGESKMQHRGELGDLSEEGDAEQQPVRTSDSR